MKYIWETYLKENHFEIDTWNNMNSDIDKYAMYGDTLSEQALWYKDNPDDIISNYKDLIYVIKEATRTIGFVICNISFIENYYIANINPIVINPAYLKNGYASLVIEDLIKNSSKLLVKNLKYIMVMIEKSNVGSIKLFEKIGFSIFKEEQTFLQYRFNIEKETF